MRRICRAARSWPEDSFKVRHVVGLLLLQRDLDIQVNVDFVGELCQLTESNEYHMRWSGAGGVSCSCLIIFVNVFVSRFLLVARSLLDFRCWGSSSSSQHIFAVLCLSSDLHLAWRRAERFFLFFVFFNHVNRLCRARVNSYHKVTVQHSKSSLGQNEHSFVKLQRYIR